MARLVLTLDGQVLAEFRMEKQIFTIGRLPNNDIRIDHTAISGHHSRIINILNDSFLEDMGSTNGTFVNGRQVRKHPLEHGDVITLGRHQLRFIEDDEDQDEFEKTMVIQPSARPVEKVQEATQAVAADPAVPAQTPVPLAAVAQAGAVTPEVLPPGAKPINNAPRKAKLQVLSGPHAGREIELSKALTTLGRPGVQVAAITRRAEGFFLVHVDSSKADDFPLLNGTPIGSQAALLSDNDVIQLANVKMGFVLI